MPNTTEALGRLRDHDPAHAMSQLSTSEREAIRDRIVARPTAYGSRGAGPRRTMVGRGRLLLAFGVVLVGGGVATAAILDQGTTTTVAAGLSCMSGTDWYNSTSAGHNFPQNGNSPTAACASEMGVPASSLIACAKPVEGVVVFEANSDPADQCKSLGLAPLPADYAAAITQIHALQRALTAGYDQSDCVSPTRLAQDANADLRRLGFTGWHAVIQTGRAGETGFAGPCGEFPATGSPISTADSAIDASNQTVMIKVGAPRSILRLAENTFGAVSDASGDQCYSISGAQQLVHDRLNEAAGHSVPVEFAVTRELPDTTMMGGSGGGDDGDGRQHYYDQGCTVVTAFGTAPNGQTFRVDLENKAGRLEPNNGPVPVSAYQPNLTNG